MERARPYLRWFSWALIAAAGAQLIRMAPAADRWASQLHAWASGLGVWAPVIFALGLAAGVVVLLPTLALTLPAGAAFGPWVGTLTISIATTMAAAMSFVIARALARRRISAALEAHPR